MTNEELILIGLIGAGLYLLFFGTWFFYIAFTAINRNKVMLKEKLGVLWYGLYPFFIVAILMDVAFNFIIGTLYYREIPQEFLFTSRCSRHLKGSGIQLARAEFVCNYLLNPFDEDHCA